MTEHARATLSPDSFDDFMREVMQSLADISQQYYWRGLPLPATLFGLTREGEITQLSIQQSVNETNKKVVRKLQATVITQRLCAIALAFEAQVSMTVEGEALENQEVVLLEFQAPALEQRMVVIPLQSELYEYEGQQQRFGQADWNGAYRADGVIVSDFKVFS